MEPASKRPRLDEPAGGQQPRNAEENLVRMPISSVDALWLRNTEVADRHGRIERLTGAEVEIVLLGPLRVNSGVRIVGRRMFPKLNLKQGKLVKFDGQSGCWEVAIGEKKTRQKMNVQPACLEPLESESAEVRIRTGDPEAIERAQVMVTALLQSRVNWGLEWERKPKATQFMSCFRVPELVRPIVVGHNSERILKITDGWDCVVAFIVVDEFLAEYEAQLDEYAKKSEQEKEKEKVELPLRVGKFAQVQRHGNTWHDVIVLSLSDDTVRIRLRYGSGEADVPRSECRRIPGDVDSEDEAESKAEPKEVKPAADAKESSTVKAADDEDPNNWVLPEFSDDEAEEPKAEEPKTEEPKAEEPKEAKDEEEVSEAIKSREGRLGPILEEDECKFKTATMVIYGNPRARMAVELHVLAAIDWKLGDEAFNPLILPQMPKADAEPLPGFDLVVFPLLDEDEEICTGLRGEMGKTGYIMSSVTALSGALVEYVARRAFVAGDAGQRGRAMEFLELLRHPGRREIAQIPQAFESVCSYVSIPEDARVQLCRSSGSTVSTTVAGVTEARSALNRIEEATGALSFFLPKQFEEEPHEMICNTPEETGPMTPQEKMCKTPEETVPKTPQQMISKTPEEMRKTPGTPKEVMAMIPGTPQQMISKTPEEMSKTPGTPKEVMQMIPGTPQQMISKTPEEMSKTPGTPKEVMQMIPGTPQEMIPGTPKQSDRASEKVEEMAVEKAKGVENQEAAKMHVEKVPQEGDKEVGQVEKSKDVQKSEEAKQQGDAEMLREAEKMNVEKVTEIDKSSESKHSSNAGENKQADVLDHSMQVDVEVGEPDESKNQGKDKDTLGVDASHEMMIVEANGADALHESMQMDVDVVQEDVKKVQKVNPRLPPPGAECEVWYIDSWHDAEFVSATDESAEIIWAFNGRNGSVPVDSIRKKLEGDDLRKRWQREMRTVAIVGTSKRSRAISKLGIMAIAEAFCPGLGPEGDAELLESLGIESETELCMKTWTPTDFWGLGDVAEVGGLGGLTARARTIAVASHCGLERFGAKVCALGSRSECERCYLYLQLLQPHTFAKLKALPELADDKENAKGLNPMNGGDKLDSCKTAPSGSLSQFGGRADVKVLDGPAYRHVKLDLARFARTEIETETFIAFDPAISQKEIGHGPGLRLLVCGHDTAKVDQAAAIVREVLFYLKAEKGKAPVNFDTMIPQSPTEEEVDFDTMVPMSPT